MGTLTAEPFDISSRYLVQGLTLMISWTSSMVKIIGQGSMSPGQKMLFPGFSGLTARIQNIGLCCDVIMLFDVLA